MSKQSTLSMLATVCVAGILSACGGGGSSYTTPVATTPPAASGNATISGTVTGFGSLIVDGKRIDNHAVAAGKEHEDGTVVTVELKLGQHVEVQHDGNLVAKQIRVNSEVEGVVEKLDLVAGSLTVLGQSIFINTDATLGPVTVFAAPYTKLADVKLNDVVEIHALIKTDAAGKSTMQATRIAQEEAGEAYNRVHGVITELSSSAHTFKLGDLLIDYADAQLLPAGAVLANGLEVHVSVPLGTVSTGAAIKAKVIKLSDRKGENEGKEAELGGPIAALDAGNKSFTINGIKVDASSALFNQAGKGFADLKNGTYVVIKGSYGSDKTLKASTIVIRGIGEEKDHEVELHGTILDFISNANFTLRGVTVDASSAMLDPVSCAGVTQLANNMQIEVRGSLTAVGMVKASSIKCEKESDHGAVVGRPGTASKVDTSAKTFSLKTERETITVQWSATTTFIRIDAASLEGKKVVVEGTVTAGILSAEKIILAQK
ncbi:MAG: DUF5666 domain-containing protein [Pseudomonadota bacterium]